MNKLREKINNKEIVIGTQIFMGNKEIGEILGSIGYDFVFICAEHTAYGTDRVYDVMKACQYAGTPVLVRLPVYDTTFTKKVLDMGTDAVLFPMIKNAEDADSAMKLCLYPPAGTRGFGPLSAIKWDISKETDFVKENEERLLRLIQIEQISAARDIENIVKNKYIDGYVLGPNDFASSMGHIKDIYNLDVQKEIRKTAAVILDSGKTLGVSLGAVKKAEELEYWREMGCTLFSLGADFGFVREGAKNLLDFCKNSLK